MELRMSATERDRFAVLGRVERRELTLGEAAVELGVCYRQAKRIWKRFRAGGAAGLVHAARGRPSNNRTPDEARERIVKRYLERYADFGPTLACEKLAEEDKLIVHPDTLVSILKERGVYEPRRQRKRHRRRRERRASFGSMVQMDGSHHDWFEGRAGQGKCVLMVLIDDATSRTFARLYASEDLPAAFDAFARWCRSHGVPRSAYVDKHSIYRSDDGSQTQFARAMKELNVELICAHSPQAKGRVERRNRVFQDRFVKELRLRNVRTMRAANDLLEAKFLPELNARFAVKARRDADLHRQLPEGRKLDEVLCVAEERAVGADWCVRWKNRWLQIADDGGAVLGLSGKRVEVRELASGELLVSHSGRRLTWTPATDPGARARSKPKVVNNRRFTPGPGHPWYDHPACGGR
jgi:transposase